jgi:DNA-binding NarL/FixJ family response regulator
MQFSSVVVFQSDAGVAQSLVASLCNSFFSVRAVHSMDELRASIIKQRAEIVIVDMEAISLSGVQHLCREFPRASVVCTHRLADEEMWTSALNAGAADICPPNDTKAVLMAALRNAASLHHAAA